MALIQYRPIESLQRHPDNPRLGDVEAIKESIRRNGWHGAVTLQKSSGYLVAGNHRTDAALELQRGQFEPFEDQTPEAYEAEKDKWASELKTLPTHVVDVDDETALRIMLADNRTSDIATYDDTKLLRLTAQIADPAAAMAVLQDENSSPDDITEALRVIAQSQAQSGRLRGTGFKPEDVEQLAFAMEPAGGSQWGSQGEGRVQIYDRWEDSQIRQLVLPMLVEEYDRVLELLSEIQEKHGLITNTDAFFWVLAKAMPRRFTAPQPMQDEAEGAAPQREPVAAEEA